MFENLSDGAGKALNLLRDVEALSEGQKELEQENRDVRQELKETQKEIARLTGEVALIRQEMLFERREAAKNRENFALQLRVAMLEFERRLPPAPRDAGIVNGRRRESCGRIVRYAGKTMPPVIAFVPVTNTLTRSCLF